jgi:1-acyl-sn-glycerol-3-phosphate acyltransferase
VIILRSILFNVLFYLNLVVLLFAALLTLAMPRRAVLKMAELWGRISVWLLRVICGTRFEVRGLERFPDGMLKGPLIVAAKHQSTFETFALLRWFEDFTFIVKRELMWVPIFGWCMWKGGMVPVDRGKGSQALAAMTARAKEEIRGGRQLIIFPEGTRRAAGAAPSYKFGVAHLYAEISVTCVPVALNSGLFWPRRAFLRYPGTIVVEFLEPIPPGLPMDEFFQRLRDDIERATARLVAEGRAELARSGLRDQKSAIRNQAASSDY